MSKVRIGLILVVILIVAAFFYPRGGKIIESDVIALKAGDIIGEVDLKTEIASFKGVPFAAPPVGNLRWTPPQDRAPWEGILQTKEHGPNCTQITDGQDAFIELMMDGVDLPAWRRTFLRTILKLLPAPEVSEDCLTLSVYAPANIARSKERPRAVMVWYHGGGHQFGAGDTQTYNATKLAQRGVIVVTINYRLGIMGFMAHPELTAESEHHSSGNYGTLDQIHALNWVQENIGAFGGDPTRVTIFGESAGGHSIGQVMASPLSQGMVHRAIAQSGIGTHRIHTLKEGEALGSAFAESLGAATLADLRALPAKDIVASFGREFTYGDLSHPFEDGWVFPVSSAIAFNDGSTAQIPLLLGSNADEGTLLAPLMGTPFISHFPGPKTPEEYQAMVRDVYPEKGDAIMALYPVETKDDLFDAINDLFGDHFFGMQAWFAAHEHSANDNPVYLYFFTRTPPSEDAWAGAYHGSDVPMTFGGSFPLFPKNDYDDALSQQIMDYWTRFAKTGNPNKEGWPVWTEFDFQDPQEMNLGRNIAMQPVARQENYRLLARQMKNYLESQTPAFESEEEPEESIAILEEETGLDPEGEE